MGNTPVQTTHTNIIYPSDWLVQGGPPYESVGCSKAEDEITQDDMMSCLTVVWSDDMWKVLYGDDVSSERVIVMETTNLKDVLTYYKDYMVGVEALSENESDWYGQ